MRVADSNTTWVQFSEISKITFVGKETICFGAGCHLIFINLITNDEQIYTANSKDLGDGICCYTGHRTSGLFAFTEICQNPRIFIKNYPKFQEICTLVDDDDNTTNGYFDIVFSDRSVLITLGKFPNYSLTVWNWRNCTKIAAQNTAIFTENQILRCSLGTTLITAQIGINSKKIRIWEILSYGKGHVLREHEVERPNDCNKFVDCLWTSEGSLFVLDNGGSVYMLNATYDLKRIINFTTPGTCATSFCWFKGGLTVTGPNEEIRHYKKCDIWSIDWTLIPPVPLKKLNSTNNILIGLTERNHILQISKNENEFKFIKNYNLLFNDICLVYPVGKFMVALSDNNKLNVFEISTGEKVSELILKEKALTIRENPMFPYLVVGYETGNIDLISTYNPNKLVKLINFYLTKKPINSIYFHQYGKVFVASSLNYGQFFILEGVSGSKIKIIGWIDGHQQFIDFTLIISRNCYQIFAIPVTTDKYLAGNKIIRYCLTTKNKKLKIQEYTFNNPNIYYTKIRTTFQTNKRRIFYCCSINDRNIHGIEIKNNSTIAEVKDKIPTGHQLRGICLELIQKFALTWSFDGFLILRDCNFDKNIGLCLPHHRNHGGTRKALVDPYNKYLLSLGLDNNLVCTKLVNYIIHEDVYNENCNNLKLTTFLNDKDSTDKCWIEIEELKRLEIEREICQIERKSIFNEFKHIQKELIQLFEINQQNPISEQLEIEDFFLDRKLLKEKKNHAKIKQKSHETYLNQLILRNNQISEWLIKNCLDIMAVPSRKILAIFHGSEVENFGILKSELLALENLEYLKELKDLETSLNTEPFQRCVNMNLETLDDKIALYGSEIQQYLDNLANHKNQLNLQNYYQIYQEEQLSKMNFMQLKDNFNKEFDKLMLMKIKHVDHIKEQNQRLRQIISEINYLETNKIDVYIADPVITESENPETVKIVTDDEISIEARISYNNRIDEEIQIIETEKIQLDDDFYDEAIKTTMENAVETRWENGLNNSMSETDFVTDEPSNEQNVEDSKALQEYEENMRLVNNERKHYRHMLKTEFTKIQINIEENINKFNNKLKNLYLSSLKLKSIQVQENLKFYGLKYNFKQLTNHRNHKEQKLIPQINDLKTTIKNLELFIIDYQEIIENDCKQTIKDLQNREKLIQEAFKKDMEEYSNVVQEHALRIYKKRSRLGMSKLISSTVLNQLAKSVVSREILLTLNQDCIEFLNSLDHLDVFAGKTHGINESIFNLICKHRRQRIAYELNWKAAQINLTITQSTLNQLQKELIASNELLMKLENDLLESNKNYLRKKLNTQIQLIIPLGLVELQLTGVINDFNDAILIKRKDIENINEIIKKFGNKKLKQLELGMLFDQKVLIAEWQHEYMKMTIEDFLEKIKDIKSIRMTRIIQNYLENKHNSMMMLTIENEMKLIKITYANLIKQQQDNVKNLQKQIKLFKDKNKKLDKQIAEINIDVCEYNLQKDHQLEIKEKEIIQSRMMLFIKRSNLANLIQQNHNEILILQTELELKRLGTYPTLKYKLIQ